MAVGPRLVVVRLALLLGELLEAGLHQPDQRRGVDVRVLDRDLLAVRRAEELGNAATILSARARRSRAIGRPGEGTASTGESPPRGDAFICWPFFPVGWQLFVSTTSPPLGIYS